MDLSTLSVMATITLAIGFRVMRWQED